MTRLVRVTRRAMLGATILLFAFVVAVRFVWVEAQGLEAITEGSTLVAVALFACGFVCGRSSAQIDPNDSDPW